MRLLVRGSRLSDHIRHWNGGIPKNGLFWTVQVSGEDVRIEDGGARLRALRVPMLDSFEFGGENVVPAVVGIEVEWDKTGSFKRLGRGDAVPGTDPAAFRGTFAPAQAVGRFSGRGPGFRFRASGDSEGTYAAFGRERNGSFL